jgi:hypothetical protein
MRSRSPLQFLRRSGAADEPVRPMPRLNPDALLIHTYPLASPPTPTAKVLEGYEGAVPPDRGATSPWPGQASV